MDGLLNQDGADFLKGKVTLDIEFAAGSSGAVPTSLAGYVRAPGITGMSLASTGLYTVSLAQRFVACTRATFQVMQGTYDASHACRGELAVDDVDQVAPLVKFQAVQNGTGAATAVTSGDIVKITLELTRLRNP